MYEKTKYSFLISFSFLSKYSASTKIKYFRIHITNHGKDYFQVYTGETGSFRKK